MGLESSSAMRELMEVGTGRHFDENSSTFDHRALKRSRVGASMGEEEKCVAAAAALEKARNNKEYRRRFLNCLELDANRKMFANRKIEQAGKRLIRSIK